MPEWYGKSLTRLSGRPPGNESGVQGVPRHADA